MSTRSRSYHLRSDCDGECDLPENPQPVSRQLRRSAPPVKSTAVRPRSRKARSHSLASRRHGPKTMKKKVIGKKKKIVRSYRSKSRSKAIHRRRPTRRTAAPRPKSKSSRRSRSVSFAPSSPNSDSRTASFSRSASPDSARRSQKSDSPSDRSRSRSRSRSSSTSSSRSAITGSYSTGSPERLMDLLEDINHTVQALNEENEKSFLSISKTKSHNPVTSSSTFSPMSVTGSSTSSSSSTSSTGLLGHLTELNNILEELQDSENDRSVDVGDLSTDFYEKIEELEPTNYADNGVTKIVIDSKLKAKSTCTLTLEEKNGERLLVVDEQIIVCPMEFQSGVHMQRHTLQMKKNKFLLNHHFFSNQQEVDDCLWSLQYSDRVLFYRRLSKLSLAGRESVHHTVSPANSIAPVSFGPDSGRLFAEDLYYSRRLPNSFARTGVTVLSFEAQSRSQGQTDALRQAMWKPEESGGHPKPIYREESVKLVGKELILETRWELKEELWQQPMDWKDRTVKSYELCPYFLHEK